MQPEFSWAWLSFFGLAEEEDPPYSRDRMQRVDSTSLAEVVQLYVASALPPVAFLAIASMIERIHIPSLAA
jgi:hypothetical protein